MGGGGSRTLTPRAVEEDPVQDESVITKSVEENPVQDESVDTKSSGGDGKVQLPATEGCARISADSIEAFEVLTTLGKGAFGRVRLARHRETATLWAIKMLKKKEIIKKNSISHVLREKNLLLHVLHPFIVKMPCAFHDTTLVYLVLEFIQGGAFDMRLRGEGSLGTHESAFYCAQIVQVFEYLHSLNYIYRDLKPANLLFDMDGYVKLTGATCVEHACFRQDQMWTKLTSGRRRFRPCEKNTLHEDALRDPRIYGTRNYQADGIWSSMCRSCT